MIQKIKPPLVLFIIVLIAAFLRFYQIGSNPPSLTWDEVAWGYNAYALGIDGRDEFGRFLPVDYLESFGDFKPPVYAYLDVLPIKIFGLNEFATRFPSALFGTLTVLLTYFLTKEIFARKKSSDQQVEEHKVKGELDNLKTLQRQYLPLVATAILAFSPWHIMLSRAAFEANVATFFLVAGVWLFLKGVHEKSNLVIVSIMSFIIAFYTFNTARIVGPILIIGLAIGYWRQLLATKKTVVIAIIVGIVLLLPTVRFMLSPQAKLRFQEVNIFSDVSVVEKANQEVANDNNAAWSKIIHNRRFLYSIEFLKHYFDNLSFHFLFITGDGNPKFSTQALGQMYLWELPFLIAGILFLFRKREGAWWIIPYWLIMGIVPAATARETPHALRIETTLPTFQILVAYGLMQTIPLIKERVYRFPLRKAGVIGLCLCVVFGLAYYLEDYYQHYPKQYSSEWQYGYKDAILYASSVANQYKDISLTPVLGRPYIYALFYNHYDPRFFRKDSDVRRDAFGFVTVRSFGNYYFDNSYVPKAEKFQTLFIDTPKDVPKGANIKKTFYLLDGQPVLVAYTVG